MEDLKIDFLNLCHLGEGMEKLTTLKDPTNRDVANVIKESMK